LQFIYEAFWQINTRRTHNGVSLQPVHYQEFEAWQRGTGNVLTHDERKIVFELFDVFDSVVADEGKPAK